MSTFKTQTKALLMTVGSIFGRRGLSTHTHTHARAETAASEEEEESQNRRGCCGGRRQVSVSAASLIFAVPVSTRQPSVTKPAGPVRLSLSALLELERTATPQGGASVWFFFWKEESSGD